MADPLASGTPPCSAPRPTESPLRHDRHDPDDLEGDLLDSLEPGVRLTNRQHMVLRFMLGYLEENRIPPSLDEIGGAIGAQKPTVWEHLRALEAAGVVTIQRLKSRGAVPRTHCPTCGRAWERRNRNQDSRGATGAGEASAAVKQQPELGRERAATETLKFADVPPAGASDSEKHGLQVLTPS